MNNLLTPILLPKKGAKWVNDSHTAAYEKSQEGKLHTYSHDVAYTKGPREWMAYSPPHSYKYKRAKRVNDLLIPTLLPIQKSQEGEKLTHSHTVAYTEEPRG